MIAILAATLKIVSNAEELLHALKTNEVAYLTNDISMTLSTESFDSEVVILGNFHILNISVSSRLFNNFGGSI